MFKVLCKCGNESQAVPYIDMEGDEMIAYIKEKTHFGEDKVDGGLLCPTCLMNITEEQNCANF